MWMLKASTRVPEDAPFVMTARERRGACVACKPWLTSRVLHDVVVS